MNAIYFLSDFHLIKQKDNVNNILCDRDSVSSLVDFLYNHMDENDVLIIGGDLTDKCVAQHDQDVKNDAIDILKRLANLSFRIMFIPGNHDIVQSAIEDSCFIDEKYGLINSIIDEVNVTCSNRIKSRISIDEAIVEDFVVDNMLIIGINSTYGIGKGNEPGSVNIKSLENGIELLREKHGDKFNEYVKIAVLHHNLYPRIDNDSRVANNDNSAGVYGNVENASEIKKILLKSNIHICIMGHTHGNQAIKTTNLSNNDDEMSYYIGGSIGQIYRDSTPIFSRFTLGSVKNTLEQTIYSYARVHDEVKWLTFEGEELITNPDEDRNEEVEDDSILIKDIAEDASDYLTRCVSEHSLLKTGHFSHRGRPLLTWLDSTGFITSRKRMVKICHYFYRIYDKFLSEASAFVGVGMKGTIFVNAIRSMYDNKYISYIPDNDYDAYEKSKNEIDIKIMQQSLMSLKEHDTIAFFTDIYSTGESIERILTDNIDLFAKKKIYVFSIFDISDKKTKSLAHESHMEIKVGRLSEIKYKVFSLKRLTKIVCPKDKCEDCELANNKICKVD